MLIVGSQLILNPLVVQSFLYTMLLLAIRSLLAPEQVNHTDSVLQNHQKNKTDENTPVISSLQ